jgi:hypothetical protein
MTRQLPPCRPTVVLRVDALHDATWGALAHGLEPYSPECVELEFCELRHNGVLGSSGSYRGALQRKEGDVVLLLPALSNEGVQFLHQKLTQRPLLLNVLGDECA